MRKNKNYYSPSAYDVHRNAHKARQNIIEDTEENTDNIDVLVMEINRENKRHLKAEPPSAPINAKKAPKAINIKKEHHSVYDEIAERRKQERQAKESISNINFRQYEEGNLRKPVEDSDVSENNEIFSHSQNYEYNDADSDFDVMQEYEVERKSHTKLWVILIIILSFLCIGLGALYAYQQGLFLGIIKYLDFN